MSSHPQSTHSPGPDLNEPQRAAVAHVDGPLLVFAGAGSGKTRVIVFRIANLLAVHRVPPYRILAVTFTNKAAGEMKHRLTHLVGEDLTRDLWVGTFHSVCARLLRRYHDAAGLSKNFVIYDDADQRAVVGRVLKELDLDDKRYPVRQVLSRIHSEKQEGKSPKDFEPRGYFDDAIGNCFARYEEHLRSANAVDFDDLLLHVLRIVEDPESLPGDDLRRRFEYVLVDEFQDVNHVQYRLVRAFTKRTHNLCAVGDDDQSIYRWRGADVRVIRNFKRDYADATVIKLEQNYRSTDNIVRSALGVIKPSAEREPKELWTANSAGEPVLAVTADSEHDEAGWVVEHVRTLIEQGTSARDIAVFYRVHAQSRVLEEVLRGERIPYQIIGGMRFFDRAEVKDILSYLRVLSNPRSDVDLLRIINVPSRKIGQSTVDKLIQTATSNRSSVFEAIGPLIASTSIGTAAKKNLTAFHKLMTKLMEMAKTAAPSEIAEDVLDLSGYQKMLEQEDTAEADARILNINELVQSIVDYEEEARAADQPGTLDGYLERVSLVSDADTLEDAPRVAMMTVHAAKGLEFDTVFLTGMEEELFPFRSMDGRRGEDIEEERRLAYVAVTRARRQLVITHASRRSIFGQTRYGLPSRFLADLPKGCVRSVTTPAALLMHDRARSFGSSFGAGQSGFGGRRFEGRSYDRTSSKYAVDSDSQEEAPAYALRKGALPRLASPEEVGSAAMPRPAFAPKRTPVNVKPGERYIEREIDAQSASGMAVGGHVTHEIFGAGVVEAVDPGPDPAVTVRFSGHGKKRIKSRFLRFVDQPD